MTRVTFGFRYLIAIALLLAATNVQGANLYRPNIIVIKLKTETAKRVGQTKGVTATGVNSIDQLNSANAAVRFDRVVPTAVRASEGGRDYHGLSDYYIIEVLPGADMEAVRASYAADPNVEEADFDYIMPMYGAPNDPSYDQQWTHHDALDKDIDTEEAWEFEVGDSTVIFGNIDSGWMYGHPDLSAATWVNPGEDLDSDGVVWDTDDINGVDDDGDGYIDDLVGYDFMPVQANCDPMEDCNGPDNDPVDFSGHGTHVGGIAAAVTDNGTGVAGVAGGFRSERRPGCKVMGLRAGYERSDGNGFVVMTACAEAMNFAVDHGASVVNCSWGSSGSAIRTAMLNAISNGLTVCKSAGNDTSFIPDIGDSTFGVLAVAALDDHGGKAAFSNYGTWVDISAPGVGIYNTFGGGGISTYATLSGTSMASPTVAGVALLLKSHHPQYTRIEIDSILLATAENIDAQNPLFIGQLGAGRVNAYFALVDLTTADFDADTTFGEAPMTINFSDNSPNAPDAPFLYTFGDTDSATTQNASHTYTEPGLFDVTFTASGPTGAHTRIRPEMIVVVRDTIEYGSVELDVGETGSLPIRLNNSHPMKEIILPISLSGTPSVTIDSMQLTGLLTDWSETIIFNNLFFGKGVWQLRAPLTGNHIPAGGGVVANLWVKMNSGTAGAVETVDTATLDGKTLSLRSNWATFEPRFTGGSVNVAPPTCNCPCTGDGQCDSVTDVFDVVAAVDVAFRGGTATLDPACTHIGRSDVNCDCIIDVFDVVSVVDVAFRGGDVAQFCDPCAQPCP